VSSSCIYEGVIRHRRLEPQREFAHGLALAYLDLEELPRLLGGRLVSPRPGLVRFRRRDYLGDPAVPLDRAVRELVSERTGERPAGSLSTASSTSPWSVATRTSVSGSAAVVGARRSWARWVGGS